MDADRETQARERDPGRAARAEAFRLSLNECPDCHWPRVCGQAFREFSCLECGQPKMHHNTCVPIYCGTCSSSHGMCCRCGGPVDAKKRYIPPQKLPERLTKKPAAVVNRAA